MLVKQTAAHPHNAMTTRSPVKISPSAITMSLALNAVSESELKGSSFKTSLLLITRHRNTTDPEAMRSSEEAKQRHLP